jgi:hypothetical protein
MIFKTYFFKIEYKLHVATGSSPPTSEKFWMCACGDQMRKKAITPLLIHGSGTNYTQEYAAYPLPSGEERKEYENS